MYIIIGLGNVGASYTLTRHNIGFEVVDNFARRNDISIVQKKHRSKVGKGVFSGRSVLIMKPSTYMNLSGEAVVSALSFYKESVDNIIVVYDDAYLTTGTIRIRRGGSAGGHNGVQNIIDHLGTNEFMRVRVGVGHRPPHIPLTDYVLQRFVEDEMKIVIEGIKKATMAVELIISDGITKAMNEFNVKEKI